MYKQAALVWHVFEFANGSPLGADRRVSQPGIYVRENMGLHGGVETNMSVLVSRLGG